MAGTQSSSDNPREIELGRALNKLFDGDADDDRPTLPADLHAAREVRECLDLAAALRGGADPLEGLISQGLLSRSTSPGYVAELGPYKILGFRGRGGMGVVLKAYEASLDRIVALKLLRPELAADAAALTRFEREAKAAANLRHPNIVAVHAIGVSGGPEAHPTLPYIVMEYVDGPSLAEVIRGAWASGPCEQKYGPEAHAPLVCRIFRELLLALDAAHRAGLIHRDVKSANILLASDQPSAVSNQRSHGPEAHAPHALLPTSVPLVKLADFGLARMRSSQTQVTLDGSILGTPEYMSPEQARGDADIDHRTDLYSAGVVLYEMLTGRTPFHCDTPTATIHRILHEEPADPRKLNKNVDPVLASLALRLMAKRLDDRPASAIQVLAALESHKPQTHRHRLHARQLVTGAIVVAICAGAGLALSRAGGMLGGHARLSAVRVSPDDKAAIEAVYGDSRAWRLFWRAPMSDTELLAAAGDRNGQGAPFVAIGLRTLPLAPPAQATAPFNNNLLLLDGGGRQLHALDVSCPWSWPDCPGPARFVIYRILPANLDGKAGDEVVVAAHDHRNEYPTRLSTVDPRSGEIRTTFWHMGHINDFRILPGFFADGPHDRPALLAWGCNNKLDGFDRGSDPNDRPDGTPKLLPGDDEPRAEWDLVSVVMILDPANMEGLGPPRTDRLSARGLRPARPWAYAFLDLPNGPKNGRRIAGMAAREPISCEESAGIGHAAVHESVPAGNLRLMVDVQRGGPGHSPCTVGGARLTVDRQLDIVPGPEGVGPIDSEGPVGRDPAYWRDRWRVIIRNGEYVD